MINVAFIVLNYNGKNVTFACLDSIKKIKQNGFGVKLIVVDNDSKDGSPNALGKLKNINLIKSHKNLGFAGGVNLGIKYALKSQADFILIINNDTVAEKNLLVNLLINEKKFDIASPKIYFAPGFEFHKDRYKTSELGKIIWYAGGKIDWNNIIGQHIGVDEVDHGQHSNLIEVEFATGACMLIKRKVFEEIGLFNDHFFLYFEDLEFSIRAKKKGFKISYIPDAIIWHKNALSTGGSGSQLQDYYFTKSRLLFAFKFARLKSKLAVLKDVITSKEKIKRKALIDLIVGRFGQAQIE